MEVQITCIIRKHDDQKDCQELYSFVDRALTVLICTPPFA